METSSDISLPLLPGLASVFIVMYVLHILELKRINAQWQKGAAHATKWRTFRVDILCSDIRNVILHIAIFTTEQ